jgi:hypothetical protein
MKRAVFLMRSIAIVFLSFVHVASFTIDSSTVFKLYFFKLLYSIPFFVFLNVISLPFFIPAGIYKILKI